MRAPGGDALHGKAIRYLVDLPGLLDGWKKSNPKNSSRPLPIE